MSTLADWIAGRLSTEARIVSAVLPALLIIGYFGLALAAYLVRRRRRGSYRDLEIEARGSSVLLAMPLRQFFSWSTRPLWLIVEGSGLPPSAITTLSGLLSVGAGVALAAGRFALGGWLFLAAGLCDFFDGRLARSQGRSSPRGAALDSVVDRCSDAAVMAGLAWYYRDSWVLGVALVALAGTFLVSYVRARGQSLGTDVKIGLMQRPERVVVLGFAVALSPVEAALRTPDDLHPMHWLAVGALLVLAVGTNLTAAQRFVHVLRNLAPATRDGGLLISPSVLAAAAASAAVATGADFGMVTALVEWADLAAWAATALGCGLGAVLNYTVNRRWVFRTTDHPLPAIRRYALVSASGALLNAGGVAVLLLLPGLDYRLAWVVVRVAVFIAWNLPLQHDYVYLPTAKISSSGAPARPRVPPINHAQG